MDVTDLPRLEAAQARAEGALGPVSRSSSTRPASRASAATLDACDPEEPRRVVGVNLNGTFTASRVVAPSMKARGYGRIANIASVAGKEGNPSLSAYSAAVKGLTRSLGKELAGYDIAVNAVTPATATARILDTLTPEFIAYMTVRLPRGRFLEVEEAAAMGAWLVSREDSFTTAAVFDLSGGRATC